MIDYTLENDYFPSEHCSLGKHESNYLDRMKLLYLAVALSAIRGITLFGGKDMYLSKDQLSKNSAIFPRNESSYSGQKQRTNNLPMPTAKLAVFCLLMAFALMIAQAVAPVSSLAVPIGDPTYIEAFPDENFRNAVLEIVGDGRTPYSLLTEADRSTLAASTWLDVSNLGIADLTGIGYFKGLTNLRCFNNKLTNLDVSANTALVELLCGDNRLATLDVSQNTALVTLSCENNQLVSLDISKNTNLFSLSCHNNRLAALDFSNNLSLVLLSCSYNDLAALNISQCASLEELKCDDNKLTVLNVSNNPALTTLTCADNQISSLNISGNTLLKELICDNNNISSLNTAANTGLLRLGAVGNQLDSLDLSSNIALNSIWVSSNKLTSLDVTMCPDLMYLICGDNRLTALNISNNTALISLWCSNNQLSELDASQNTQLEYVECSDNQLSTISVANSTPLYHLNCRANQLTNIDLRANLSLEYLDINKNSLNALDISKNTKLKYLYCTENQITVLDLSNNPELVTLRCEYNNLSTLDLAEATLLEALNCDNNQLGNLVLPNSATLKSVSCGSNLLTTLNVSMNPELELLWCAENLLPSIDLSNNANLIYLWCPYNKMTSLNVSSCLNLKGLYCHWNQLPSIDVSKNLLLEELWVGGNALSSLDVTNNTALDHLYCEDNNLTALSLSQNNNLTRLTCNGNQLAELDLRNNTNLLLLHTDHNDLTSLDLSANTKLTEVRCQNNQLTSLVLPVSNSLEQLACGSNQLAEIDVSRSLGLTHLHVPDNKLTSFDVSANTALIDLLCYQNQLTGLDVSHNLSLETLYCDSNRISSLDLSNNIALAELLCDNNLLSELDLSHNAKLSVLVCYNNFLTELKLSANPGLTFLWCSGNLLTTLDISSNTALEYLYCYANYMSAPSDVIGMESTKFIINSPDNLESGTFRYYMQNSPGQITFLEAFPDLNFRLEVISLFGGSRTSDSFLTDSDMAFLASVDALDISSMNISNLAGIEYFTGLTILDCSNNLLTWFNLSANTALVSLNCSKNQLTELIVSPMTSLQTLDCSNNLILELNVSGNILLNSLYCVENRLTSLDISQVTQMTTLYCFGNYMESIDNVIGWSLHTLLSGDNVNSPDDLEKGNFLFYNQNTIPTTTLITITSQPHNTSVTMWGDIVENAATLSVIASAEPYAPLHYQWYQQLGSQPDPDTDRLFGTDDTLELPTEQMKYYAMGEYYFYCIVSADNAQSVYSSVVRVMMHYIVKDPGVVITLQPVAATTVTEGSISGSLYIGAEATDGSPCYYYQWYTNTIASNVGGTPILGETSAYYIIPKDLRADGSPYYFYCEVAAGIGQKFSEVSTVYVLAPETRPTYLEAFPDSSFRRSILQMMNAKDSGNRTETDIFTADDQLYLELIESLVFNGQDFKDLTGLEYFSRLWDLRIYRNPLAQLDVSKNPSLTHLTITNSEIGELDLTKNVNLTFLSIEGNQISQLDLSQNIVLTSLNVSNNQLTQLDLSKNTALEFLDCSENMLTGLDLSNNVALTQVNCQSNFMKSRDDVIGWVSIGLHINSVSDLDSGTLRFYNQYATPERPLITITQQPVDDYVSIQDGVVYKAATLVVVATVEPEVSLNYQWYQRIGAQPDLAVDKLHGTGSTLVLPTANTQYIHPGILYFYCVVSTDNGVDLISDIVEVEVAIAVSDPGVDILTHPVSLTTVTEGSITGSLCIEAASTDGIATVSYQWYSNSSATNEGGTPILGETTSTFAIPNDLTALGSPYYYYCEALAGIENKFSEVATVVVIAPEDNPTYAEAFLDTIFREAVLNILNSNDNGNRTESSDFTKADKEYLATLTALNVSKMNIADMAGLEHFSGLWYLHCNNNLLTELDLTALLHLRTLECSYNMLTKLDVTHNPEILNLYCSNNQLTELDLSKQVVLVQLACSGNLLTELDISSSTNCLLDVYCDGNLLTSLDVSGFANLRNLYCYNNNMTSPADVKGWQMHSNLQDINSPTNVDFGTFRFYNQNTPLGPVITIDEQPQNNEVQILNGTILETVTLSVTASSEPEATIHYQWYQQVGAQPDPLVDIADKTGANLEIPTAAMDITASRIYYYYCVISADNAKSVISSVAQVGVLVVISDPGVEIVTQPIAMTTVTEGSINGSLFIETIPIGMPSEEIIYQWYSNTTSTNIGGTAILGATQAVFTIPVNLTAAGSPYYFYCVAIGGPTADISDVATVVVNATQSLTITITTQPQDTQLILYDGEIVEGTDKLTVAVSVSNASIPHIVWYEQLGPTPNLDTDKISGEGLSFDIPLVPGLSRYYCVVSAQGENGVDSVISRVATVGVNEVSIDPGVEITVHPMAITTVTEGSVSGKLNIEAIPIGLEQDELRYQWYTSTTNKNSDGVMIAGATAPSFTIPTNLTAVGSPYYFFCVAIGGPNYDVSNIATVHVLPPEQSQLALLESIAITSFPAKTVYSVGEPLALSGMIVTGHYSDGSSVAVGNYTVSPASGFILNTPGQRLITVTYAEGSIVRTVGFNVTVFSDTPTSQTPTYQISSDIFNYVFTTATAGYSPRSAGTFTISNTGNQPTGSMTVSLTGNTYAFSLSRTSLSSIAVDDYAYFSVSPVSGLPAGIYNATVTIRGNNGIQLNITLRFTVNASTDSGSAPIENGTTNTTPPATTVIPDVGTPPLIETPSIGLFTDMKETDWYYQDVMSVFSRGLMLGTNDNPMTFSPNSSLTRGMIVTILYRMIGSPDAAALENPFDDVANNTWYTDALKWASAYNIVSGYGDGKFGPNNPVTREQLSTILNNYSNHANTSLPAVTEYPSFVDQSNVASYANDAVRTLAMAGIINGKPGDRFDPKGQATRAEAATMLMRFINLAGL